MSPSSTASQELFDESQQRIDRDINRPLYGWMSTDFDSRGHLLETRRVHGGFSDEKLSRICQIYGEGAGRVVRYPTLGLVRCPALP